MDGTAIDVCHVILFHVGFHVMAVRFSIGLLVFIVESALASLARVHFPILFVYIFANPLVGNGFWVLCIIMFGPPPGPDSRGDLLFFNLNLFIDFLANHFVGMRSSGRHVIACGSPSGPDTRGDSQFFQNGRKIQIFLLRYFC